MLGTTPYRCDHGYDEDDAVEDDDVGDSDDDDDDHHAPVVKWMRRGPKNAEYAERLTPMPFPGLLFKMQTSSS